MQNSILHIYFCMTNYSQENYRYYFWLIWILLYRLYICTGMNTGVETYIKILPLNVTLFGNCLWILDNMVDLGWILFVILSYNIRRQKREKKLKEQPLWRYRLKRKRLTLKASPVRKDLKLELCGMSQVLPCVSRALTTMREAWSGLTIY